MSDMGRNMQVIVREFVEADREALRKLFVISRDAAFSWVTVGTHQLEDFDVSTAGERILVAEHASHPIGFASVWQDDSFLHNLFVHPRHQGLGVGTMLLAGCDKYFSSVPTLKCLKANARAKQFYQSRGWHVRSEADGPEGPYVLMERAGPNSACKPNLLRGSA
ncbi:GNAT family N-acetyltransferase [Ralstonia sp. 24A2]|uniref:GNAT family N-acetyltransferase n=1 Tax=Ralstonia sp. 24A2 TaxID=3447364 RepID=UPI003F6984FE